MIPMEEFTLKATAMNHTDKPELPHNDGFYAIATSNIMYKIGKSNELVGRLRYSGVCLNY